MNKLIETLSPQYVNSVLQYGKRVEEMIAELEAKGGELAQKLNSLEELEGASDVKGDVHILLQCPMVPVLSAIKKVNAELTGEEILPDFYPQILEEYIKKHQEDAAVLHPLCIAHQHIRKSFGEKHGLNIQQIACRSGSTGKVVYSEKGLQAAGMTEAQAYEAIGENACLFLCKKNAA